MMKKLIDSQIKYLFKSLKTLMFWPHPQIYKEYTVPFHIEYCDVDDDYKFATEQKLLIAAEELNSFIQYFPLSVYIETTNMCNLKCIMCPHKTSSRKKGCMPQSLFRKIVDEIAEKQPSIVVSPFYFGEPLMDKDIFEKLTYCKKKGLTYIKLSTNGSLLSINENYKRLIDSGVDHIVISIDGITKGAYESIRIGSRWEIFCEGIDKLIAYKETSGSHTRVIGQMINIYDNSEEKKAFLKNIIDKGLEPYLQSLYYWGQPLPNSTANISGLRYPCNNPLYSAVILKNGELNACCMDFEGSTVFGNLNNDTLEYIWQNEHSQLRKSQMDNKYDSYQICSNCFDWINFGYNKFAQLIDSCLDKA